MTPQDAVTALRGSRPYDDPVRGRQNSPPLSDQAASALASGPPATRDTRKVKIIRHGATKLNDNNDTSVDRLRGWKDVPLSDEGREEVEKIMSTELVKDPPDRLVTSDLSRARETAEIASKATGVPIVEVSRDFRPWDVGNYAGQTTKEAIPVLADYAENHPDEPIPGGEPFNTFRDRLLGGLMRALEQYDGLLGIVTHHRDERLLHAWRAAGYPPDGHIDIATFNQKGEPTGNICDMDIPLQKLELEVNESGSQPTTEGSRKTATPTQAPARRGFLAQPPPSSTPQP